MYEEYDMGIFEDYQGADNPNSIQNEIENLKSEIPQMEKQLAEKKIDKDYKLSAEYDIQNTRIKNMKKRLKELEKFTGCYCTDCLRHILQEDIPLFEKDGLCRNCRNKNMKSFTQRQKELVAELATIMSSLSYHYQTGNSKLVKETLDKLESNWIIINCKPQEWGEIYDICHRT